MGFKAQSKMFISEKHHGKLKREVFTLDSCFNNQNMVMDTELLHIE